MTAVQVHAREVCGECDGLAIVTHRDWRAYYADHPQQQAETVAMLTAAAHDKLDARLAVFHLWWADRLGCLEELAASGAVPVLPPEEIPCGTCVGGWVERWVSADQIVPVAA